jgi:hypothetical protein
LKLRFAVVTICIVLVSILSLHAELPTGTAQQAVTVTSLSFVTVTAPSWITVSRVSYVTVMGAVSYVTQTVISLMTVVGPVSYVTKTIVQPHQKQDDHVMTTLYKMAFNPTRSELPNSPAPIPEYNNVWPILMICMIFILATFRSKSHKRKAS